MESEPMKLELGGGDFNRGGDWTNMDLNPVADIVHDLELFPYPQADESVDELYSSHCLEHLVDPIGVMNEISRICKVGARVEIRVPHPNSNHAMCAGHKHVFGPMVVRNCDHHFPHLTWSGQRRLFHQSTNYGACELLADARRDLPFLVGLSDEKVMKWIPGTCHECCFHFVVGDNPTPFRQTGFNGAALDYLDT
jgi:predicted SAM-dependent methyltransferase